MSLTHEEDTQQSGQGAKEIVDAGRTIKKAVDTGKRAYDVGKDLATGDYGKLAKDILGSTVDPRMQADNKSSPEKGAQKAAKATKNAAQLGKQAVKVFGGPKAALVQEIISKILKNSLKKVFKPIIGIAVILTILISLLPSWFRSIVGLQIGETNMGIDNMSEEQKADIRLYTGGDEEEPTATDNQPIADGSQSQTGWNPQGQNADKWEQTPTTNTPSDTSTNGNTKDLTGEDQEEENDVYDDSLIGSYSDDNLFKDSMNEMERISNKTAKKAKKYAKKDAISYAKSKNDRWCKVLNEKEKPVKSWKWLYTTDETRNVPVNKADAIIAADLIIRKQKAVENGIENPDEVEVTTKEIYKFLTDKNHLKGHFYHLTYVNIEEDIVVQKQTGVKFVPSDNGYDKPEPVYTEVTEKQAGSYITVYTYDIYDLFAMGGLSPNDKYAYTTTFYDVLLARREQLRALATEEQYKALGLAYDTPLNKEHQNEISAAINAGMILGEIVDYGENATTVWNALKSAGFSDVSAAALCGNLQAESSFRTNSLSSDGNGSNGIAQWTGNRLINLYDYSNQIGLPWDSIEAQTRYLLEKDLPVRLGQNLEYFKSISDITEAADYVCIYFESPAHYASYEDWKNGRYGPNGGYYIAWSRFESGYSEVNHEYNLDLDRRRQHATEFYNSYHE